MSKTRDTADVVLVGLGASGCILAKELTEAGFRVIALERGPEFADSDFLDKFDELRYHVRLDISPNMETAPVTWRPDARSEARLLPWGTGPLHIGPLFLPPSLGTGGGTVHYSAWHWRHQPSEFRMASTIREAFGKRPLPDDLELRDWPIDYDALEPHYDRVDWEIGVSGKAGNVAGTPRSGGNPFEPYRQRDYPMPPLRAGAADADFARAAEELGYNPFPAPLAISSEPFAGYGGCTYCGFCRDFPCHVGAKASAAQRLLPQALATGNLEIRANAVATRVDFDADGKASGVAYRDAEGRERQVSGATVILAAYSLENVRLLLASGYDDPMLGKRYMTHNYGWFTGTLDYWTNPFVGPAGTASAFDDLNAERGIDPEREVFWGTAFIGFTGDLQPIEASRNLPPEVPPYGADFKRWFADNYRRYFSIYSQTASLPAKDCYLDLDPQRRDAFGQPALRITHRWKQRDVSAVAWSNEIKAQVAERMPFRQTWQAPAEAAYHVSTHEVGGHVMGEDPADSVVDRFQRAHRAPNLFLVGGGSFPTLGSYNPTHTIQALAYWTAEHIKAEAGVRPTSGREGK